MHTLKSTPKPYVKSALCPWIREDNTFMENESVQKYCEGFGLDIGCGNNRFSDTVLAMDVNPNADAEVIWDCRDLPYPFKDGAFDFVVSSHCLEDFAPEDIQNVFNEWMRILKVGSHLCLLVPDMEGGRYPDVNDKWMPEDELVKRGERNVGDCRGNSAHRITMGRTLLHKLVLAYNGPSDTNFITKASLMQCDTLPQDQMTMDWVLKKLA